jgi:hypothetical protein
MHKLGTSNRINIDNMKTSLTTMFFLITTFLFAQTNLVPNPSFEEYTTCPNAYDQIYYSTGWDSYLNTCDYYNSCSSSIYFGVPENNYGYQLPSNPNCHAYAGMANYNPGATYGQELLGRKLDTTLTIGQKYYLSMKVSLSSYTCYCASNNFGFLFSITPYDYITNPFSINNFAHYNYPYIITDTTNWTKIFGSFVADSAYKYIIIGNFFDLNHTDTLGINGGSCTPNGSHPSYSYYYIDDVCVSTDSSYCYNFSYNCEEGITNYKENNINIFPNPSTGELTIDFITTDNCFFELYDGLGAKRKAVTLDCGSQTKRIDLTDIDSGLYSYSVVDSKGNIIKTGKLIVLK